MKRLLSLLLVVAAFAATAQTPTTTARPVPLKTGQGVNQKRLARIDGLLQQYVDKGWMPGATALVMKDGKVIYHKSFGWSNKEEQKPLANDAIFRIASQTKAITSVGVMMLWEEGRLLLDDPISKYIPEFKKPNVLKEFIARDSSYTTEPARSEITIRQLLSHTSGIGYAQIGSPEATAIYAKAGVVGGIGINDLLLGDKIKILGGLPLFHQPGERWSYGLNTDVLGYLIEVISGQPLDQFFAQRIFTPLGMKDTYFYLPPAKRSRLVKLYSEQGGSLQPATNKMSLNGSFNPDYPAQEGTYFSGGGGLSSTAADYGRFMQMLLNGGTLDGVRLLSPATVSLMTTNQIGSIKMWSPHKFGLGFELVTPESKGATPLSIGSFSWGGMFSSSYWIDPKEKIVAQLFINVYPTSHGDVHDKFKAMLYAALE